MAEKYFLRIKSNLTLTTIVDSNTDEIAVIVISSGGSSEMGFTWGCRKKCCKAYFRLLEKYGIHILNIHKMSQQLNAREFF